MHLKGLLLLGVGPRRHPRHNSTATGFYRYRLLANHVAWLHHHPLHLVLGVSLGRHGFEVIASLKLLGRREDLLAGEHVGRLLAGPLLDDVLLQSFRADRIRRLFMDHGGSPRQVVGLGPCTDGGNNLGLVRLRMPAGSLRRSEVDERLSWHLLVDVLAVLLVLLLLPVQTVLQVGEGREIPHARRLLYLVGLVVGRVTIDQALQDWHRLGSIGSRSLMGSADSSNPALVAHAPLTLALGHGALAKLDVDRLAYGTCRVVRHVLVV